MQTEEQWSPEVQAAWDKAAEEAQVWSVEQREAWLVAAYARRFEYISKRGNGFFCGGAEARTRWALKHDCSGPDGRLNLFDVAQAVGASDLDLLCGQAVAVLKGRGKKEWSVLSEVLEAIGSVRVAAIYYALPRDVQRTALNHLPFAFCEAKYRHLIQEAQAALDSMIYATPTSSLGLALASADLGLGSERGPLWAERHGLPKAPVRRRRRRSELKR